MWESTFFLHCKHIHRWEVKILKFTADRFRVVFLFFAIFTDVFRACPTVIHWCMNTLRKNPPSANTAVDWLRLALFHSIRKSFVIEQNSWQLHKPQTRDESWFHIFRPERQRASTYQPTQTQNFLYKDTCGNTGAQTVWLSPQIYCTICHKAPKLAVSVLTILKVIWDQPPDQNAVECADTILMQHDSTRPHIAYQCVVTAWEQ